MSGKPKCVEQTPSPPVTNIAQRLDPQAHAATTSDQLERWLPWVLAAGAIFILFYQLGAAALFEPDEGRNAEKAREILLLQDWLTPHENFHPVLDKPIFFYWLIALSYKLFGVSEWAARLPSAVAALGCLGLVYSFARARWGERHALWTGLILLTSLEFFLLARLVIFDMPLTFFLTVALCAFYQAGHSDDLNRRRLLCLLMYGALGAATLIKGLIGIVVPGMVIFGYLLLSKRWSILRNLYLIPGTLLFLAVVLPWYLEMGARHEGYLRYYFWQEHFGRFASNEFDRTQPWYYFIVVGLVGFFPWTLLLLVEISGLRRRTLDDQTLFLLLWVTLPLLFFSASRSKLPHYILPIFPPLAILTASRLVGLFSESAKRARLALSLAWISYGAVVLYFIVGYWQPAILPRAIVHGVSSMPQQLWFHGVLILVLLGLLLFQKTTEHAPSQSRRYLVQLFTVILFLVFTAQLMIAVASMRSAKGLGDKAAPLITAETQVVFYDTYLSGMGFYLRSEKPIWVITHSKKKRTFLGNYYALGKRAEPNSRWGKALFDFDEFRDQWQSAKQPLVIFAKEKSRARLAEQVGEAPKAIASVDDYVVLAKP